MKEQFFVNEVSKNYNLRHHIQGKPSVVYMVVRVRDKQYKISMGVKVLPEHWGKCKAMVSPLLSRLDNLNNNEVNKKILEYDRKFSELISYLCMNPEEMDNIDNVINSIKVIKKKENRPLAIAVLRTLLREKPMGDTARYGFNKQLDNFYEFLKTLKKDIYMSDIDVALMRDYQIHLHNTTCTHKITGETVYVEDNTVRTEFNNILTILSYAEKAELIDLTKINKLKEKGRDKTEDNQVYLTDEEFAIIKSAKLKDNLSVARDLFCLQLDMGQRFSDIDNMMGKKMTITKGSIEIIQQKTGARVTIPLTPYAIGIFKKYDYVLPKYKNTNMNKYLKKIGKICNINSQCQCRESRNGKPYIYSVEKWQLISTHTARRSFVSNNIKDGISADLIKSVTGHASGAFERYNRVSQEDLAEAFVKAKMGKTSVEVIPANPDPNPEPTRGVMLDDIDTMRKILMMLGENPIDVMEMDAEMLWRRIAIKEYAICDKVGCDYKTLKDIFNSDMSLKDKITKVNNLLNN